jgi:TRAP transporter TAXI family solute receptor
MSPVFRVLALSILALVTGCSRGPDEAALASDVQARLDAVFGRPQLEVAALNRQGSAPFRAADDGARQVIVYFNTVVRFAAAYDPSDWESLSPALIANALGATDRGISGLGPGRHEPGTEFRGHGSLVYRKADGGWVAADDRLLPIDPAAAGAAPSGVRAADELVQRLAQLVMQSPEARGADREIITEEIDRAVRNINLRLGGEHAVVALAAGPAGGEYFQFLTSITGGLRDSSRVRVVATEGSVANAFMLESNHARLAVIQSDVAAAAVTGHGVFAGTGPMNHLRGAASLFPEPVHIVVRADSDINGIADLAGLRIALGSPQSGSRHTAMRLLATAGVDPGGLARIYDGDPALALERLAAGELDAVVEVTSAPWQQLLTTLHRAPLRLVAIDPGAAARVAAAVPGLVPLSIPARTYPGQKSAVPTVAATALLVARSDSADVSVESALTLLYATAAHRGGVLAARLSKERAQAGMTIPMHEGARRYFDRPAGAPADSGIP